MSTGAGRALGEFRAPPPPGDDPEVERVSGPLPPCPSLTPTCLQRGPPLSASFPALPYCAAATSEAAAAAAAVVGPQHTPTRLAGGTASTGNLPSNVPTQLQAAGREDDAGQAQEKDNGPSHAPTHLQAATKVWTGGARSWRPPTHAGGSQVEEAITSAHAATRIG
eukprot:TRINITY_DN1278_c0_g2_i1.p1 TRINITY_DN1278_c0_g2~~TRINITY_DN1278_c0_g2_i1.p1  ORF type:complete len:166 (+),score=31.39 TRINITY_DN1278_c0_g2_i1:30-527(+)